jgi:hypothetical protein
MEMEDAEAHVPSQRCRRALCGAQFTGTGIYLLVVARITCRYKDQ